MTLLQSHVIDNSHCGAWRPSTGWTRDGGFITAGYFRWNKKEEEEEERHRSLAVPALRNICQVMLLAILPDRLAVPILA
jgi:hypothetical protein